MTLTAADNGKTVRIAVGETIEVHLGSNPSTGYTWEAYDIDPSVLARQEERFEAGAARAGASGTRIFSFTGAGPGESPLRFKLLRGWLGESSVVQRFEAAVTVALQ